MGKHRKVIVLNDGKVSETMKKGTKSIKSKDTLMRICKLAGGSILGQVAVAISNYVFDGSKQVVQYGAGSVASAVVTIATLGLGYTDVGIGAGVVTANQLVNTASSMLTGKSLNQHLVN